MFVSNKRPQEISLQRLDGKTTPQTQEERHHKAQTSDTNRPVMIALSVLATAVLGVGLFSAGAFTGCVPLGLAGLVVFLIAPMHNLQDSRFRKSLLGK